MSPFSGKSVARRILNGIPRSRILFTICRYYVNRYNGENNADLRSNGELRWIREVVPQCRTIFDVGANVGDFTDLVLKSNPAATVHVFEPSVATHGVLSKRGFRGDVRLNLSALSSAPGEGTLRIFAAGSGINSLETRVGLDLVQTESESVRLDTVDAYCSANGVDRIDLLKLDVEGHELAVLKGSRRMLEAGSIKRIQFEYGGTYIDSRALLKDAFDLLLPFGYKLGKILPDRVMMVDRYDQQFENFQYQNWIAVSRDGASNA